MRGGEREQLRLGGGLRGGRRGLRGCSGGLGVLDLGDRIVRRGEE